MALHRFTIRGVANLTEDQQNQIFDCGCFTEVVRGYLILAMEDEDFSREDIAKVLTYTGSVFEDIPAAEARAAYRKF